MNIYLSQEKTGRFEDHSTKERNAYTFPPLPRVPLSYQASACSLSTLHFLKIPKNSFEVLKLLENSVEVLKILENKLESMKILENKLESLKLQENQPPKRYEIAENHREEEDQEGNNSPEIETLPLFSIYGCSHHDFFGVKALDLSSDHSVLYSDSDTVASPRPRAENEPRGQNELSRKQKWGIELPSIVALVMVIDKSWTSLGKHEKAFYTGLKKFVDDCKPLVDSAGNIRCPCKSCRLVLWVSIKHLSDHISKYGFDPSYKTWIHHGEPDLPPPPPVIDNHKKTSDEWKDSNTPGKKVPKKVLRYFPIIPRLQRLYKSSHTTKEMNWHATGKCMEPDKMQHPVDGRVMGKDFDTKNIQSASVVMYEREFFYADIRWFYGPSMIFLLEVVCLGGRALLQGIHNGMSFGSVLRARKEFIICLMNDKSKDTAKARQDLKSLGIRSGLWLGQNKNGKCSKPQAAYSFTPADRKKFCQFIKGVKLPDGFGSNFKHKVTDNDTNITGLKSHDCHIMMQHLLPYGLQQYLPPDVAKPLIELCLFFKQICSQTLMVDDMLKAQSKVIDILCNLELIYPPAFFDIMIHLVIHLPIEAIFGRPIRPRWMYPFERYMKKLKNYVRNKAKPKGSIAESYVAEEALTFSSHYFRDVTTKFNRPDRNVDCPPPTCQFQVFKSLCKSIGLRSVIRIDHQELKKVIWYVLYNSPEIDTYRAKFKIEFPNKDMKEEFPGWFGKQLFVAADAFGIDSHTYLQAKL
ncbi:hypothetical protein Tco_0283175 [Tanacetum coccineum]